MNNSHATLSSSDSKIAFHTRARTLKTWSGLTKWVYNRRAAGIGIILSLTIVLTGLAAPISAQDNFNPFGVGVPLKIEPQDFNFKACIDSDDENKNVQIRAYRLTSTSSGAKVKIIRAYLSYPDKTIWNQSGKITKPIKIPPGGTAPPIQITFKPKEQMKYTAKLTVRYSYNAKIKTVKINITGEGVSCPKPPASGAAIPNPGSIGTPDGGTKGDSSKPATKPLKVKDVCVFIWLLPGAQDIDRKKIDKWIEEVNKVFKEAGLRFIHKKNSPGKAPKVNNSYADSHCYDIYVGSDTLFSGNRAGETPVRGKRTDPHLEGEKVHERFKKYTGIGESSTIESGDQAGLTLAHELGHALGLGSVPPRPESRPENEPDDHLDPETGQPITDKSRLMHPQSTGTKLIDMEKRIARKAVDLLKGSSKTLHCEKSHFLISDPSGTFGEDAAKFQFAEIRNLGDSLEISTVFNRRLPEAIESFSYGIKFDTDAGNNADWWVRYDYDGDRWQISNAKAQRADMIDLDPPSVSFPSYREIPEHGLTGASGLTAEIPKELLGKDTGSIGWRVWFETSESVIPEIIADEAYHLFDITNPLLFVNLNAASKNLIGVPGGFISVSGVAEVTSTFSGRIEFSLRLSSETGFIDLPLGVLEQPIPADWQFSTMLPEDLQLGGYQAFVVAECSECGAATSVITELVVSELSKEALKINSRNEVRQLSIDEDFNKSEVLQVRPIAPDLRLQRVQ